MPYADPERKRALGPIAGHVSIANSGHDASYHAKTRPCRALMFCAAKAAAMYGNHNARRRLKVRLSSKA